MRTEAGGAVRTEAGGAVRTEAGGAAGAASAEKPSRRDALAARRRQRAQARQSTAGERIAGVLGGSVAPGERPHAPWHPLPLSELLILIGILGIAIGLRRGDAGAPLVLAGVGAVLLGTGEVALREHLGGYRSHTLILTLLPIIALDTALKLIVAAFVTPVPVAIEIVALALNVPLFAVLFKLLRARYQDARRERVSRGGR